VVSTEGISSPLLTVEPGRVCGLVQDGVGYVGGRPLITLHMEAYLGAPESYDSVDIDGTPKLSMKIAGGVHGDVATASITVNSIPKVLSATPGLHTMRTLPIPSWSH
jgi:4-hydroxy-tetrahydrodipicolinate reductase